MITIMYRRSSLLALALTVTPMATVQAAPPAAADGQDPACASSPSLEEARLIAARDFNSRGEADFEEGDYLSAIERWEQVLILMPDSQATLRVQLAHAHLGAYRMDADPAHLYTARELFTEQAESVDPEDREDLDAELANIEAELTALAQAEAETQAQREDAIRQEQIRLNELALAEAATAAKVEAERKTQRVYYGVGGSLAGLGLGSVAAMGGFLGLGAGVDSEGQQAASRTDMPQSVYAQLNARGEAYNRGAIITGVVGGVLTVSGTALLVLAATRQRNGGGRTPRVAFSPGPGGAQLRF